MGIDAKKAARGVGYRSTGAAVGQSVTNAASRVGAELTAGTGVVGRGSTEVTGGAMAQEVYRQNAGRNGVDPQTGEPWTIIPLSQFATGWTDHRIGAWLQHFRPDLYAQAQQVVQAGPHAGA